MVRRVRSMRVQGTALVRVFYRPTLRNHRRSVHREELVFRDVRVLQDAVREPFLEWLTAMDRDDDAWEAGLHEHVVASGGSGDSPSKAREGPDHSERLD